MGYPELGNAVLISAKRATGWWIADSSPIRRMRSPRVSIVLSFCLEENVRARWVVAIVKLHWGDCFSAAQDLLLFQARQFCC